MNEWVLIGIGVLLTVGTGFFVASEFALVSLDRPDLEARRDAGEKGFTLAIRALTRTSTHLSSAQLGITITTLLTGWLMEPAISSLLAPVLLGWGLGAGVADTVSAVVAILIATILSMIVGELFPKNLALAVPRRVVKIVAPFQLAFTWLFSPFVLFLVNMSNGIVRAMGIEPKEELSSARTAEELASAVRHSSMHGTMEEDTATLLGKALSFTNHEAQDIMTPRTRVATIRVGDSLLSMKTPTTSSELCTSSTPSLFRATVGPRSRSALFREKPFESPRRCTSMFSSANCARAATRCRSSWTNTAARRGSRHSKTSSKN
jgi:CBS domain containing-hemolysin-like protein